MVKYTVELHVEGRTVPFRWMGDSWMTIDQLRITLDGLFGNDEVGKEMDGMKGRYPHLSEFLKKVDSKEERGSGGEKP